MTIKHFLKVWDNWQKNVLTMNWDRNQIALQVPKLVRAYICSAADCRKKAFKVLVVNIKNQIFNIFLL